MSLSPSSICSGRRFSGGSIDRPPRNVSFPTDLRLRRPYESRLPVQQQYVTFVINVLTSDEFVKFKKYHSSGVKSSPVQDTGSQTSWQNWTVATKLTVGVDGNLNALKFAESARDASSRLRAGKISSLTGQPVASIKFNNSPLSVLYR